jgi:hypothetical protein
MGRSRTDVTRSQLAAQRQLVTISAGCAERRETMGMQARALARQVDYEALEHTLRARKLLATLGPRIVELAGEESARSFGAAVQHSLEAGRRQASLLELLAGRAVELLRAQEIPVAVLKGPALAQAIYGDHGRRLSGDVDLLVAPEQLSRAVQVVRTLGYREPIDHVGRDGLPLLHHTLVHERGELPTVELHWRVHWYERRFAAEQLLPAEASASAGWRAPAGPELLSLLLFYARDGFTDLRLACDIGAWWDGRGAHLDPNALARLLERYPQLSRATRAGAIAVERIVGAPLPTTLGASTRPGLRGAAAVHLANPNPSCSQSQLFADIGLLDGLLAPPGGLGAFARRQLVPPRQTLLEHARHGGRQKARWRLTRLLGVLARYVRAGGRLARPARTRWV